MKARKARNLYDDAEAIKEAKEREKANEKGLTAPGQRRKPVKTHNLRRLEGTERQERGASAGNMIRSAKSMRNRVMNTSGFIVYPVGKIFMSQPLRTLSAVPIHSISKDAGHEAGG